MISVDATDRQAVDGVDSHRPSLDGDFDDDHLARLITENLHLQAKLASLPVIEQAKGILIGRYGLDADTAFALLRRWSSHTNVKLREVCRWLVDAAQDEPSALGRTLDRLQNHRSSCLGTVAQQHRESTGERRA